MYLLEISVVLVAFCCFKSEAVDEYYGKEVGPLSNLAHGVKGTVFVIDSKRIGVRDFSYDGTAPAAFFWIGVKGKHGSVPDKTGIAISDENGRRIALKKYTNANVILTLPADTTADQLKYLSVWCHEFFIDFGHAVFPDPIDIPSPVKIGQLSQLNHGVGSGDVSITDHKTGLVKNFAYDGKGKDVFFVAGNGSNPSDSKFLIKLPRVVGGLQSLPEFGGSDTIVRFPGPTTVFRFRFLAVYSNATGETFGQVNLPATLNVPPFTPDPVVQLP